MGCIVPISMIGLVMLVFLAGCGEPASTWDPKRGRFVNTDQYRLDQINREIDKRELQKERDTR